MLVETTTRMAKLTSMQHAKFGNPGWFGSRAKKLGHPHTQMTNTRLMPYYASVVVQYQLKTLLPQIGYGADQRHDKMAM